MFAQLSFPIRLVLVLALGAGLVLAIPARAYEQEGYVPGEVVVKLTQAADLPAVAAGYNLDPVPLDQFGTRPIYRLRILDEVDPHDKAVELAADARVVYAEPNFEGQAPEGRQRTPWAIGGDSGKYATQWAPAMIRLPEAHRITRGAGITIAVLDTGVDATHPALAGRLVQGYDFVDMDGDPSEVGVYGQDSAYGHGTHVAGVLALAAPEASLMPVRVLDRDGVGNVWVLSEALVFAVDPDGNPATSDGADVINMSLGTRRHTNLLAEIVLEITCSKGEDDDDGDNGKDGCLDTSGHDVVVVAAAGNSGASVREYPAAEGVPGLLALAASTSSDGLASFSTFGPWVQVAAPGENVVSSVPGGGYGTWSGTSMAAPFAAGQAALVRSANPNLTASEVVQRIIATAVRISGLVPLRIDTAAALGGVAADKITCRGFLGAVTVDNLSVPEGATCMLDGTRVKGTIKVERNATLYALNVIVDGNVQAKNAARVEVLPGSVVDGSIQIVESGAALIDSVMIDSDLFFEKNNLFITTKNNQIGGNLQAFKNTGGLSITGNQIDGSLQCKENFPAPTGGGNLVMGNMEDQCANLK